MLGVFYLAERKVERQGRRFLLASHNSGMVSLVDFPN